MTQKKLVKNAPAYIYNKEYSEEYRTQIICAALQSSSSYSTSSEDHICNTQDILLKFDMIQEIAKPKTKKKSIPAR